MIKKAKSETGQGAGMKTRPSRIRTAKAELQADMSDEDKELTRRLILQRLQD